MAMTITTQELIKHLTQHYAEEALLVVDIWSSADVEILMDEPDEDGAMDIWADVADSFTGQFDHPTTYLNDTLYELIQENG